MQQWKISHFGENLRTLLSKGKTQSYFKNFNDKNISSKDFTNLLFYTLHPFEIKNYAKIISPVQKAITMAIYIKGGYITESEVINFLNRHWNEITAVSKQRFSRRPDLRLLHMNMAIKKKGMVLFVKNPDDPEMIDVNNANITGNGDYASDDSAQEEAKPMKSRERSKVSNSSSTSNFNAEANNSDSSFIDIDANKDDDDTDDMNIQAKRGGRFRGRQRYDNYISIGSNALRETRSKKDKKINIYNSDEKEKQTGDSNSSSSDYNSNSAKSSDYHYGMSYGRGPRKFPTEPIHQTSSLSSMVPVKSASSSINMMKVNSTLILPPVQKIPAPSFSMPSSVPSTTPLEGDDNEDESGSLGTGLSVNWKWCNFSMSTAERILFFPLSKPFESSADSVQIDPKFDFDIPNHISFEEIVVFVVNEACLRASNMNSTLDAAVCGITIDQIAEKIRDFRNHEGMYFSLPLNERIRAILLEAKELKLVDHEFFAQRELWFPRKIKNNLIKNYKEGISKVQSKFKFSLPKPFANLKIKELTISQMYEKFSQDKTFGLKCTEFIP